MKSFQLLTSTIIAASLTSGAYALPTGGVVTSGTANMAQTGNTLNINQGSSTVNINWQTFSSALGETINFNQKASDVAVNHVLSKQVSTLDGLLNAQGKVVLINNAGITIGKSGQVNTGALSMIAGNLGFVTNEPNTAHGTSNNVNNYLATGGVTNNGTITTTNGGVTLFGTGVANSGSITSAGNIDISGTTLVNTGNLTAGTDVSLTTGNIYLEPTDGTTLVTPHETQTPGNQSINAGGTIKAGNSVTLQTSSTNDAFAASTINLSGVVDTKNLTMAGTYVSTAATANVTATGTANISGTSTLPNSESVSLDGTINAGSINVTSVNDLTLYGHLQATSAAGGQGQISIKTTHGPLFSNIDLVKDSSISADNVNITSVGDLTSDGKITATAASGRGQVSLNAGTAPLFTNIEIGSDSVISADNVNITATGDITHSGKITSGGQVSLTSGVNTSGVLFSNIDTEKDSSISANKVTINSGSNITSDGKITATDGINISAKNEVTFLDDSNLIAANAVNLNSADNLTIGGAIKASTINLTSKNRVSFLNSANLTASSITSVVGGVGTPIAVPIGGGVITITTPGTGGTTTPSNPAPIVLPPGVTLPTNGQVTSGSANIHLDAKSNTTLDIDQTSNIANINWDTFSSSANATINFNQTAGEVAINHVVGTQVSTLNGLLNAGGKVVLINENGIVFGKNSQTNVGELQAIAAKTTLNDAFGNTIYSSLGSKGFVENDGVIISKGDVDMFADSVTNNGIIAANANITNGFAVRADSSTDASITLSGNNITNTGTLAASFGDNLNNGDSLYTQTTSVNPTVYNQAHTAQTINAGGMILGEDARLTSTVDTTAARAINLTGTVRTQTLEATSGGDLSYSGTFLGADGGQLYAAHDLNILQNSIFGSERVNLTSGNDLNINSAQIRGGTDNYGYVSATSGHDLNINSLYPYNLTNQPVSGNSVNLNATNNVNINGAVTGNSIGLKAGNDVIQNDYVNAKNVSITAGRDYHLASGKELNANFSEYDGNDVTTTIAAGRDVNLDTYSSIYGNSSFSDKPVSIKAGRDINANGVITSYQHFATQTGAALTATHDINIGASGSVNSTGIALNATNNLDIKGQLESNNNLTANHNLSGAAVNLESGATINTFSGQTNITSTAGDVTLTGNVDAGTLNVNSAANLNSTGIVSANTAVNLNATGSAKISGNYLNYDGSYNSKNADFTLKTGGDVDLSNATIALGSDTTHRLAGGNLTITAGKSYVDNASTQLVSNGSNGGNITISAATTANISGLYDVSAGTQTGNTGGKIALSAATYNETATAKFKTNGEDGGSIKIKAAKSATLRGSHVASGASTTGGTGGTIGVTDTGTYADSAAAIFNVGGNKAGTIGFDITKTAAFNGQYAANGTGTKAKAGIIELYSATAGTFYGTVGTFANGVAADSVYLGSGSRFLQTVGNGALNGRL